MEGMTESMYKSMNETMNESMVDWWIDRLIDLIWIWFGFDFDLIGLTSFDFDLIDPWPQISGLDPSEWNKNRTQPILETQHAVKKSKISLIQVKVKFIDSWAQQLTNTLGGVGWQESIHFSRRNMFQMILHWLWFKTVQSSQNYDVILFGLYLWKWIAIDFDCGGT